MISLILLKISTVLQKKKKKKKSVNAYRIYSFSSFAHSVHSSSVCFLQAYHLYQQISQKHASVCFFCECRP